MSGRAGVRIAAGLGFVLALGGAARAQQRPSESQIFGPTAPEEKKPAEPEKPAEEKPNAENAEAKATDAEKVNEAPPAAAPGPDAARDEAILGVSETGRLAGAAAPDDPLKIGGMFYLRPPRPPCRRPARSARWNPPAAPAWEPAS
jgi:hypothetical protein